MTITEQIISKGLVRSRTIEGKLSGDDDKITLRINRKQFIAQRVTHRIVLDDKKINIST